MTQQQALLITIALPIICFLVGFLFGFFTGLSIKKGGRE